MLPECVCVCSPGSAHVLFTPLPWLHWVPFFLPCRLVFVIYWCITSCLKTQWPETAIIIVFSLMIPLGLTFWNSVAGWFWLRISPEAVA